jgi:Fe-S cluster assembly ATPase SufC
MQLVAKLDDYGKPAWIAVMIVSFIIFWPIGLAILLYLIWSGRMAFWKDAGRDLAGQARRGCGLYRSFRQPPSTGNRAFDEYRAEALRRLEDEQKEFTDFLERLRKARDKTEFDQFMAERGGTQSASAGEAPEPKPAV